MGDRGGSGTTHDGNKLAVFDIARGLDHRSFHGSSENIVHSNKRTGRFDRYWIANEHRHGSSAFANYGMSG